MTTALRKTHFLEPRPDFSKTLCLCSPWRACRSLGMSDIDLFWEGWAPKAPKEVISLLQHHLLIHVHLKSLVLPCLLERSGVLGGSLGAAKLRHRAGLGKGCFVYLLIFSACSCFSHARYWMRCCCHHLRCDAMTFLLLSQAAPRSQIRTAYTPY